MCNNSCYDMHFFLAVKVFLHRCSVSEFMILALHCFDDEVEKLKNFSQKTIAPPRTHTLQSCNSMLFCRYIFEAVGILMFMDCPHSLT